MAKPSDIYSINIYNNDNQKYINSYQIGKYTLYSSNKI